MERTSYPSDLTDDQWQLIEPLLPKAKAGGRPRKTDMREVINGILYIISTECSWRELPGEFPPWPTVHDYYQKLHREKILKKIRSVL
jgi:putative transposase